MTRGDNKNTRNHRRNGTWKRSDNGKHHQRRKKIEADDGKRRHHKRMEIVAKMRLEHANVAVAGKKKKGNKNRDEKTLEETNSCWNKARQLLNSLEKNLEENPLTKKLVPYHNLS